MLTISSSCFFSSSASAMRQVVTCLTSSRGLPMYSFYEKDDEKKNCGGSGDGVTSYSKYEQERRMKSKRNMPKDERGR